MFRSSIIIRELAMNLAKFIFTLKHSVNLHRYLLCGCVTACHGIACVLYAVSNAQLTTQKPFHDMLPHNRVINNDVISPNFLTFIASSLMMVEDRNINVYLNVNFNVFFKLIEVHLFVNEVYIKFEIQNL